MHPKDLVLLYVHFKSHTYKQSSQKRLLIQIKLQQEFFRNAFDHNTAKVVNSC